MSISFPDNWARLRYPNIRSDLLLFLKELSNVGHQKNYSVSPIVSYDRFDVDEIYHFFFDDTDLGVSPENCIDKILFNSDEVKLISDVTKTLKKILEDLGDCSGNEYISHPDWKKVIDSALFALNKLSETGVPLIT